MGLLASEQGAGGTQAKPACGISALWVTRNIRGKITVCRCPGFTESQVNLEVQSIPSPR